MSRSSTSPFRGTGASIARSGAGDSTEMLIRSLEQENNALVDEISVLKNKAKKTS